MIETAESETKEYKELNIGDNTIIGEKHLRSQNNPEDDESFQELLDSNKDSIFILEGNPNESATFKDSNTFMSQTLGYTKENNYPCEILDDNKMKTDRYGIWQEAGTDISQETFDYANALHLSNAYLLTNKVEDVVNYVKNSNLEESRKQTYYKGIKRYLDVITGPNAQEELKKTTDIIRSFLSYDSICRERYYQGKLAMVLENNPGKKVFAVFGEAHIEGMSKIFTDKSFRTSFPNIDLQKQIDELQPN